MSPGTASNLPPFTVNTYIGADNNLPLCPVLTAFKAFPIPLPTLCMTGKIEPLSCPSEYTERFYAVREAFTNFHNTGIEAVNTAVEPFV